MLALVSDQFNKLQSALYWERRKLHAGDVAESLRSLPITLDMNEADEIKSFDDVPLLQSLITLNRGASAWSDYASYLEAALLRAGCSAGSLKKAKRLSRRASTDNEQSKQSYNELLGNAISSYSPLDACTSILSEALAAAQLHQEISESQTLSSEKDCGKETARILLLDYAHNGFASNFGVVAGALIAAMRMQRVLVLNERVPWVYNGGPQFCSDHDGIRSPQWECYFERFGSCTFLNSGISDSELEYAPPATEWIGVIDGGPRVVRMSQESQFAQLFYHSWLSKLTPPRSLYARYGNAWWRTHVFLHLWRPKQSIVAAVQKRVVQSGLLSMNHSNFLAWHVRHGDKARELRYGRRMYRTSQYASALTSLAAQHPDLRDVFLSSDDPVVVKEAAGLQLFKIGRLRLFSLNDSYRLGGQVVEAAAVAEANPSAAFVLALDAIANIAVMSEAPYSLGTFHSNFGRLASEFRYAKGSVLAPYVFRDQLDCDRALHVHPDRDSYFIPNVTRWYLPLRQARRMLGLPPGFFSSGQGG